MDFSPIESIALYAVPVVLAITLHEAAHGYIAKLFGDNTAALQGRVTLNPLKHIDLVGTIVVPLVLLLVSKLAGGAGFLFGWAKPVPVNFGQLRNPKRDMLWVAAAGPGANLLMATAWAVLYRFTDAENALASEGLRAMGRAGVLVNVFLMVLNLFPILPLDGGRIAMSLLPHSLAARYARMEPYGFMIVVVLLASNVLDRLMTPLVIAVLSVLQVVVGY